MNPVRPILNLYMYFNIEKNRNILYWFMPNKRRSNGMNNLRGAVLISLSVIGIFCTMASACLPIVFCPPCPACYTQTGQWPNCHCEWYCTGGSFCCNGECCYSSQCESCVGGGCSVCGGDPNKFCCNGTCADTDANEACCDNRTKYNEDTKHCCGDGDGHTCNWRNCMDCNSITHGCDLRCKSENCQTCDGKGNCIVCDGDPNMECCNGTCCNSGQICCNGSCCSGTCCNGSCCPTGKICNNGHCCSAPNGCGSAGGPPFSDNPAGCSDASFLNFCNAHDECYGQCGGSDRDTCDDNLWDGLTDMCAGSSCAVACQAAANAYYGAIDGWGDGAFADARACSCGE